MIFLGIAAWRTAHLVVSDTIAQPTKEKALDLLAEKSQGNKMLTKFSEKADEASECIYCMTFWTALLMVFLNRSRLGRTLIQLFVVWGIATLIGVAHNKTMETLQELADDEIE